MSAACGLRGHLLVLPTASCCCCRRSLSHQVKTLRPSPLALLTNWGHTFRWASGPPASWPGLAWLLLACTRLSPGHVGLPPSELVCVKPGSKVLLPGLLLIKPIHRSLDNCL